MKNIKLYDVVKVLVDKNFICPVEHVKKGFIGTVVDICKKNDKTGYIVEIDNDVYDFEEDEIEVIEAFK